MLKVTLREYIIEDRNVLPGRCVLTLNSNEYGEVKFKARYVVGRYRDKMKDRMVHKSSTLEPQSVRLLLSLTVMLEFDIWTSYVRHAYLKSATSLEREVFVGKPSREFELSPKQCLLLLKPLYDLCE